MKANFETGLKICSSCKKELPIENYNKCKTTNDGLCYKCRDCEKIFRQSEKGKEIGRKVHQKYGKTEEGKETAKRARQKYYKTEKGKECQKRTTKNYQKTEAGMKTYMKSSKKYNQTKMGKIRRSSYEKNKRFNDLKFLLIGRCRVRLNSSLKGKVKSDHTLNLLGCTVEEFKQHLENQFIDGMSWDNYGEWHIDHIIPCAAFDLEKEENQRICFNFRNLQPLWADENRRKKDTLPENCEELLQSIKQSLNIQ